MKEKSIEEQLDLVLKFIINGPKEETGVIEYGNSNYDEFVELLDKIHTDKFIRRESKINQDGSTETKNLPTVEGRYFLASGGYTAKLKRDKVNSIKNILGNRMVLFGAGSAGVYYLLEILRTYISPIVQHACDCQFVWQK